MRSVGKIGRQDSRARSPEACTHDHFDHSPAPHMCYYATTRVHNATHIPSNTSSAEYGTIDAAPEDSGDHTAGQTGTRILSPTYSPIRMIHIKTDDKDCNK